jgi:hypothetical protein
MAAASLRVLRVGGLRMRLPGTADALFFLTAAAAGGSLNLTSHEPR